MKLRKNNWERKSLGEISTRITDGAHIIPREQQTGLPMLSAKDIKNYKIDFSNPRFISKEDFEKEDKRTNIQPNDILLTIVGTIGRCAMVLNEYPKFTLQRSVAVIRTKANPKYLLTFIDSPTFQNQLNNKAIGTAQKGVYLKSLSETTVLLPTLPEQTQIAELFQSIETAIEQAEQQDENLLKLKKTLSNGITGTEPQFGKLLNKKNCSPTNFGGVADCIEQHDKQKKDVSRFIGLENIEPENLKITTWGDIAAGTTFTKKFSKGDVLFGKRRAYLKKVAVAEFDGICSGDILVLRAKEKKMLPELLPFYVSAEAFINHAVSTSAGSLSPRTKWRDLSSLEISIPDLKTQEKILEVFQQIETTLSQLQSQKLTLKNLKQKLLNEILG